MPALEAANATTLILPEHVERFIFTVKDTVGTISWIVGGIFGLYLIFLILKWIEFRRMNDVLADIRHNLLQLNKKLGVENVSVEARLQEGTIWQRTKGNFRKFLRLFKRKKR